CRGRRIRGGACDRETSSGGRRRGRGRHLPVDRPSAHAIIRAPMTGAEAINTPMDALERQDVWACDNCGAEDWTVYGVTPDWLVLHPIQCRCRSCGLVFTTPRVTPRALRTYYRHYFDWFPGVYDPGLDDSWLPQ